MLLVVPTTDRGFDIETTAALRIDRKALEHDWEKSQLSEKPTTKESVASTPPAPGNSRSSKRFTAVSATSANRSCALSLSLSLSLALVFSVPRKANSTDAKQSDQPPRSNPSATDRDFLAVGCFFHE
jgi:hypothetical protein